MATPSMGDVGIRSWELSDSDAAEAADCASELEELGFGALWLRGGGFFERGEQLARATTRSVVASSVLSTWALTPLEASTAFARIDVAVRHRLLLGVGISHAPIVNRGGERYQRPIDTMVAYLSALDGADTPVPASNRIVAALGPRMLEVARNGSLGAHPYLVPVEHTAQAREALGANAVLAPALVVVADTDPSRARARGRDHLGQPYLGLPNYTSNLERLGFSHAEFADGGSDRLVDALVAWGEPERIAERVREHLDAGADHVALHVLPDHAGRPPRAAWRRLAHALDLA